MPAVVIGGLLAAGGAVAGAAISSGAASSAANTAATTAANNDALQSQIYNSNKGLAQPYIDAGTNAETALQGFLGIGGDPAASQKALNDYLNSTGYQFTKQQGLDAVTQSKAASGLLGSGATLKALDAYGAGLADQYGQQYEGNLQGLANTGQSAASGLAGAGQSYANAVTGNNNNAANTAANATLTGASATTSAINNAIKGIGAVVGGSSFAPPANAINPGFGVAAPLTGGYAPGVTSFGG